MKDKDKESFERAIRNMNFEASKENQKDKQPQSDTLQFDNELVTLALMCKEFQSEVSVLPEHIKIISNKLEMLAKDMRLKNHEIYFNFEKKLFLTLNKASPLKPDQWLASAFAELVKRVGEDPSWRAMTNIVNCINLITVVANIYERKRKFDRENLEIQMRVFLESFLNKNFSEFIIEMGGWIDFLDYYSAVSARKVIKPSPALWPAVMHAATLIGLSVIIIYSFK